MEEHQETCLETRLRQSTGEEDLTGVRNLIFLVDTNVTQVKPSSRYRQTSQEWYF